MLKKLIGSQLVAMDEYGFDVVTPEGYKLHFYLEEDEGDCCGFNEISNALFITQDELKRNPIITNVEISSDDSNEGDECLITFYGENKAIAEVSSYSSSGSGWGYGATVTLKCKELKEELVLTSW